MNKSFLSSHFDRCIGALNPLGFERYLIQFFFKIKPLMQNGTERYKQNNNKYINKNNQKHVL